MKTIRFEELGRLDYPAGLITQQRIHAEVLAGAPATILSLEHDPVFTLGRRTLPNQFLPNVANDIPVVKTDRGGEITYHGPGQAVLYLMFPLQAWRLTLPELVGHLEQSVMDVATEYGVETLKKAGWRGVFVGAQKLASLGLAVHHDVTMHGLALNVDNDLEPFTRINPCGLNVQMCSLQSLGKHTPGRAALGRELAERFAAHVDGRLKEIEAAF